MAVARARARGRGVTPRHDASSPRSPSLRQAPFSALAADVPLRHALSRRIRGGWLVDLLLACTPRAGCPERERSGDGGRVSCGSCGWWSGFMRGTHPDHLPGTGSRSTRRGAAVRLPEGEKVRIWKSRWQGSRRNVAQALAPHAAVSLCVLDVSECFRRHFERGFAARYPFIVRGVRPRPRRPAAVLSPGAFDVWSRQCLHVARNLHRALQRVKPARRHGLLALIAVERRGVQSLTTSAGCLVHADDPERRCLARPCSAASNGCACGAEGFSRGGER